MPPQTEDRIFDVVCLGLMVADVVAVPVTGMPPRGGLSTVERMELHTGGCAVNTGISLARLGMKVGLIGRVGQDGFGEYILSVLQGHGIDTAAVRRDPLSHTSGSLVLVDHDGERSFIHHVGANGAIRERDVDMALVGRARILHVAGSNMMPGFDGVATARVLQSAQTIGVITSLDTAWDPSGRWLELIEPALPHIDFFVPSLEEAKEITRCEEPSAVAHRLLQYGVKTVVLKMGGDGCYVTTSREEFLVPAYPVPVVDTTGAGDAFAAGFLAGVVKGWRLREAAALACAVGACCVTAVGATTGIRSLEETMAFVGGI